ncbi:MAG: hypothetical protein ACYDDF_05270 [Thermoplasmatota archaeon]
MWRSALSQVEIVQSTQRHWREIGALPNPRKIDHAATKVAASSIAFANRLLEANYSELSADELTYKGFFEVPAAEEFAKVIAPPKQSG